MSTGTRLLAVGMSVFTVSSKWRCSCCRTDKHRIMQSIPKKQAAVAIITGFKFQAVQLLQCLFLAIILIVLLLRCKTVRVLALQLVYIHTCLVLCFFHHINYYY